MRLQSSGSWILKTLTFTINLSFYAEVDELVVNLVGHGVVQQLHIEVIRVFPLQAIFRKTGNSRASQGLMFPTERFGKQISQPITADPFLFRPKLNQKFGFEIYIEMMMQS